MSDTLSTLLQKYQQQNGGIGGDGSTPAADTSGATAGSSGTTPVDTSSDGSGGFDWSSLLDNAGSILSGGAQVINSINKTPQVQVVQPNAGSLSSLTSGNSPWLLVGGILFVIVILFLIFKK